MTTQSVPRSHLTSEEVTVKQEVSMSRFCVCVSARTEGGKRSVKVISRVGAVCFGGHPVHNKCFLLQRYKTTSEGGQRESGARHGRESNNLLNM